MPGDEWQNEAVKSEAGMQEVVELESKVFLYKFLDQLQNASKIICRQYKQQSRSVLKGSGCCSDLWRVRVC